MSEERLPAELVAAFAALRVATVYEATRLVRALDPAIRPLWPGARLCGSAFTVRCHAGDNLAIHHALARAAAGHVLVVDARAHLAGYWGEILTAAAKARGIVGLVIDGGVRDVEHIAALRFPVFARGAAVFGTVKHEPGQRAVPVVVGGALVEPGDLVLADADGVVAVPRAHASEVLAATRERDERERAYLERVSAGELTVDVLRLPGPPD